MENFEYHKEILGLPKYVFPAAMLVFGHYNQRPEPRPRFDKKYVVFLRSIRYFQTNPF